MKEIYHMLQSMLFMLLVTNESATNVGMGVASYLVN
jgi:hypothetical protein